MPTDCLFCRIAAGDVPAHKVYEDEAILAFLDLHPVREGHTLVIPKDHHVWFEDVPAPLSARVMICAQALARSMKQLYRVPRVAMFYTGIHVAHAHAHVLPMHDIHDVTSTAYMKDGPDSFSAPPQLPTDRMAQIAEDLRSALT